jgi:hypothetical protein
MDRPRQGCCDGRRLCVRCAQGVWRVNAGFVSLLVPPLSAFALCSCPASLARQGAACGVCAEPPPRPRQVDLDQLLHIIHAQRAPQHGHLRRRLPCSRHGLLGEGKEGPAAAAVQGGVPCLRNRPQL